MPQIAFVSLVDFKLYGESAPPTLVLDFFPELLPTKGVALFRGKADTKLSRDDCQYLFSMFLTFYGENQEAFDFVNSFNHKPEEFQISKLIDFIQKK